VYRVITDANAKIDILPCVVKAIDSGSSIDVFICKTHPDAQDALKRVVEFEERALAPIRITTTREFYDFQAKYKGNFTEYHFDLNLPDDVVKRVQELALRAHQVVGCRDLSRVDLMLDENQNPFLIEINTLPGFTPKSLLPKAAAYAGIAFGPLVDRLVRRAFNRKGPAASAA
jgi:D-alanine-D-alanine ligase